MSAARPQPLTAAVDHRHNNFDVLRLIAAVLVVVSHSVALTGGVEPAVPFTDDTLGFDGVLILFAISGMLITRSWVVDGGSSRSPEEGAQGGARALGGQRGDRVRDRAVLLHLAAR